MHSCFRIITLTTLLIVAATGYASTDSRVMQEDRPRAGTWDFRPRLAWEVDLAEDAPFSRAAEVRALADGTVTLHDFERGFSYLFDQEGQFVASYAGQGEEPGQVSRYLNCFAAGNAFMVGAPDALHFYDRKGVFQRSWPNNLFERFPLIALGESRVLLGPGSLEGVAGGRARLLDVDLESGNESILTEFSVPAPSAGEMAGPVFVIPGLTPQVFAAHDPVTGRIYWGRNDEYRIHATDREGRELFAFGLDRPLRPSTEQQQRDYFAVLDRPEEWIDNAVADLPDRLTHFARLQVQEGLIYVLTVDGLERDPLSAGLDLFSEQGEYLYRARLRFAPDRPIRSSLECMALSGNRLYVLHQEQDGRQVLASYTLTLPPAPNAEGRLIRPLRYGEDLPAIVDSLNTLMAEVPASAAPELPLAVVVPHYWPRALPAAAPGLATLRGLSARRVVIVANSHRGAIDGLKSALLLQRLRGGGTRDVLGYGVTGEDWDYEKWCGFSSIVLSRSE